MDRVMPNSLLPAGHARTNGFRNPSGCSTCPRISLRVLGLSSQHSHHSRSCTPCIINKMACCYEICILTSVRGDDCELVVGCCLSVQRAFDADITGVTANKEPLVDTCTRRQRVIHHRVDAAVRISGLHLKNRRRVGYSLKLVAPGLRQWGKKTTTITNEIEDGTARVVIFVWALFNFA